jgi:hypothetical protein
VAGLNMAADLASPAGAGSEPRSASPLHTYRKAVPLNVTRLAGYRVVIMGRVGSGEDADLKGIARGDSETWRRMSGARTLLSDWPEAHTRLMLEEDVVTGAVVIGDPDSTFCLQGLIAERVRLGPVADRLAESTARPTPLLEQAWLDHRRGRVQA